MKIHRTNIFLIDGIGAVISAILLGVVLPAFQVWIGMPIHILYLLATMALIFAAYSLSCFYIMKPVRLGWLKAILFANVFYCVVTGVAVIYFFDSLTGLGLTYFLLELAIILSLVIFERKLLIQAKMDVG